MTEPLTTEVLDEGERLCREATPGPFVYIPSTGEIRDCEYRHIADTPEYDDRSEDMRLFAFARNHLADLLASARRELAMQQKLAELAASFRKTASVLSDRSVAGVWLEAADRVDQLRKGEG